MHFSIEDYNCMAIELGYQMFEGFNLIFDYTIDPLKKFKCFYHVLVDFKL